MRSNSRHLLTAVVLIGIASAIAACSHDTLDSGTEALAVNYTPNPAGAGRYERGTLDIQTIQALPTDPDAGEIYDPANDTLLFNFSQGFIVDLTRADALLYSRIALSQGSYQITKFRITTPSLVDEDVSTTPATCIEGVAVVDRGSAPGVPATVEFLLAPEFQFTVRPDQTTLAINVNIPGLIAGYESAFTCQFGCGIGGAPCLTAFDTAAFRAAVLANVSFE